MKHLENNQIFSYGKSAKSGNIPQILYRHNNCGEKRKVKVEKSASAAVRDTIKLPLGEIQGAKSHLLWFAARVAKG